MYAYGVDLTPLAYLKAELEEKLQEKRLIDAAWMETKRQISYYRGQIKAVMCEMELLSLDGQGDYTDIITELDKKYAPISIQIRTHLPLEKVRELLASHKELYALAVNALEEHDSCEVNNSLNKSQETHQMSPKNDSDDVHYNSTIKKQSNKLDTNGMATPRSFQESSNQLQEYQRLTTGQDDTSEALEQEKEFSEAENLILQTGLQHITLKQALNAASDRFRAHMPMEGRPMNWNDFVEAAYKMKGDLMIAQSSWARACATLGRPGAAICLLLTDQAQHRERKPVHKTGAYFNAMINRAKDGELHLHNSIFGILKREYGDMEAA